jgi:hypothetical protein
MTPKVSGLKYTKSIKNDKSAQSYSIKARHLKQRSLQAKKQAIRDNKGKGK